MKTKLFVSLSAVALLGVSAVAYGDWVWYNFDESKKLIVRPESAKSTARKIPNGNCLEMMCKHGCVENEKGEGFCCPSAGETGDSCTVANGAGVDKCCKSGICIDGKCGCQTHADCTGELLCLDNKTCGCASGTTEYTKMDGTNGCCDNTTHVLADIPESANKACCPKETPLWDGQKCVECIKNKDCLGDWVCRPDKTCGCEKDYTPYKDLQSSAKCCKTKGSENVLVDVSQNKKVCCPSETPYWDGKKCVDISCSAYPQAGIADEKTYTETFVGKATDGITDCRCPIGKPFWAANDKKCKSCSEIDATRIYWNKERQKCVECLANYGSGDLGACTNQTKPWCNPDGYTCQACPSGTHWNDTTHTCVLTDCMGNSFKSKDDWSVNLCPRTAIDADYDVYISGSAPYGTIAVCGITIAHRGHKKVPDDLTFNPNTVYATIKKGTSCGIWVYTNWGTYGRYRLDVRYVRKN